jgi:hypothetical protein
MVRSLRMPQLMRLSLDGHQGEGDRMTRRTTTEYGRVRSAPETDALNLAGRIGFFVGQTRPSSSRMPVVGDTPDDYALALYFKDLGETFWFPPELLDYVNADGSPFVPDAT